MSTNQLRTDKWPLLFSEVVYSLGPKAFTSPFYTVSPHYLRSNGSPILRQWWFTQSEASCLGREGWRLRWFIFITNTGWVKVFCQWQMLFFGQKCDKEDRQEDRRLQLQCFFSSHALPKTVTVTMLLLSCHVTLLCGTFLCWVKDLCSCQIKLWFHTLIPVSPQWNPTSLNSHGSIKKKKK